MATGKLGTEVKVVVNRFPEMKVRFPQVVSDIISKTTFDIYAESQITVPVRKDQRKVTGGALKNSGQVTYDKGSLTGTITYSIYYAVYVHEGTRYMTARPFLKNAYDDRIDSMIAAFATLERRLA